MHGDDDSVVEIAPNTYLIDGSMPVDEVVDLIGFEPEEASECETAGGLLLALFDRIPDEGDEVDAIDDEGEPHRAHFVVEKMDNLRVDKIRMRVGWGKERHADC